MKKIDMPYDTDSELQEFRYTIPEGYEAEIVDGEVIVKKAESEDERIRKDLMAFLINMKDGDFGCFPSRSLYQRWIAWLEKQKELFESGRGLYYYDGEKTTYCGYPATEDNPYDFAMSQQEKQKELSAEEYANVIADEEVQGLSVGGEYIPAIKELIRRAFRFGVKWGKEKEQKPVDPSDDELQRHQDELYNFKVFAAKQAKEHHISFVHDFEWNNFCAEILSYFNEQKPAADKVFEEWVEDYWSHNKVNNPYSYNKGDEIQFDHKGFVSFCEAYCYHQNLVLHDTFGYEEGRQTGQNEGVKLVLNNPEKYGLQKEQEPAERSEEDERHS